MRYNIIKTLVKKELIDIFRDKKTVFMMIILPVLLYPVIMLGAIQVTSMIGQELATTQLRVGVDSELDAQVKTYFDAERIEFIEVEDYNQALEEEIIDGYLEVETEDLPMTFNIYYNSSEEVSGVLKNEIEDSLEAYREEAVHQRLEAEGLDIEEVLQPVRYNVVDVANQEEKAGHLLAMILPFLLIVSITSSAIYPAIDVMAGEKERGTIETLLTLPVKSVELIVGKYIAVSIMGLLGAILNIVSIGASIGLMVVSSKELLEQSGGQMTIALGEFAFPLAISILSVLLFTLMVVAMSLSICTLAKTFKEAQNYTTPLLLLVMLPSYVVMIPTIELTPVTASIPVVNVALLMKSVLTFNFSMELTMLVFVSNIALVILSLFVLIKLFDSEEILFGNGQEFRLLQRRYNIQKGSMPTTLDAVLVFGVALLGLIYIGQWIQIKMGFAGIALTQVILGAIAIGFALYLKSDLKKLFSLKWPGIKGFVGAFILWIGTWLVMMVVGELLIPLSPHNEEVLEGLTSMITHENLWINLFVVALLPAICEEILFRGIIYKGLSHKGHVKRAMIISSLLFGLMHMDLIRIPLTAGLGLMLAYSVYKTGSIWVAVFIHFINNGLAVVSEHVELTALDNIMSMEMPMWQWTLVGIVFIVLGIWWLKKTYKITEVETSTAISR